MQRYEYETNKEYYQDVLKDVKKLYVAGVKRGTNPNWDRGIWRLFNVYFINKDNELERVWFGNDKDVPSCWSQSKNENLKWYFKENVLGSDRVFEIVYSLGIFLFNDGYKFKEEFLSW